MSKKTLGLDDSTIISLPNKSNKKIENFTVNRAEPIKTRRYTNVHITVVSSKREYKLIQRIYPKIDNEFNRFNIVTKYNNTAIPNIYYLDFEQRIILMDDLDYEYFSGCNFDENNEYGIIFRENYNTILSSIAKFHGIFWENYDVFGKIGLDKRLESKENLI
jgi:hypothetical protein